MTLNADAHAGGAWRLGWKFGCIGTPSVIAYLIGHYLVTAYMVLYNMAQAVAWSVVLFGLVKVGTFLRTNLLALHILLNLLILLSLFSSPHLLTTLLTLLTLLQTMVSEGATVPLWDTVGSLVHFWTLATVLEIVHPLMGMVKASIPTTAIQVPSLLSALCSLLSALCLCTLLSAL
jgi:hypothetical protein